MDKKISNYIASNKVFTIATCLNNIPYCATCFYVFNDDFKRLIFLSDENTRHLSEALLNKNIAGTITIPVITIAKLQGIQFTGQFIKPNPEEEKQFYDLYYDKFPFAKAKPSAIWGINLEFVKMTDNTLGFGKKLIWKK